MASDNGAAVKRLSDLLEKLKEKVEGGSRASLLELKFVNPLNPAQSLALPREVRPGSMDNATNAPLLYSNFKTGLPSQIDADLKAHGEKPDAYPMLCELGSAVVLFTKAASRLNGYKGLSEYRAGLLLSKGYGGIHVRGGNTGTNGVSRSILLNPFYNELYSTLETPRGVAGAMLHTLKHEAVHHRRIEHDAEFTVDLGWLDGAFHDSGDNDRMLEVFTAVISRHWKTYEVGRSAHERAEDITRKLRIQAVDAWKRTREQQPIEPVNIQRQSGTDFTDQTR